ncbi:MAG TPA: hypothetical protein VKU61_15475 [Candidatus Binatia bacterium]|nr:hypothetical protein [Candidatus Binatia bacterium]
MMRAAGAAQCGALLAPAARRRGRELAFWLVLVALVVGVSEGAAALASAILVARGAMAAIPRLGDDEIALALERRSAQLGWGPATDAIGRVLHPAARRDPAFPPERRPCASVYGDSFTLGAADNATYPHHLALALGCPVANFGVGGYGSDQALMLFRAQRVADRTPVVLLAHLSENVMRNVNQCQRLLYPASRIRFKPRFLLDGDALRAIPVPVATAADYRRVAAEPGTMLAHDAFLARPRPHFPYTVQLLRWLVSDSYAQARLHREPWHAAFYRSDHPSGALDLTTRILSEFVREAGADGRTPLIVLIATRSDLDYARRTGRWAYRPLVDALDAAHVPVVDTGPLVRAALGASDLAPFFVADGHPSGAGYAVLGRVLAGEVERRGIAGIARAGTAS